MNHEVVQGHPDQIIPKSQVGADDLQVKLNNKDCECDGCKEGDKQGETEQADGGQEGRQGGQLEQGPDVWDGQGKEESCEEEEGLEGEAGEEGEEGQGGWEGEHLDRAALALVDEEEEAYKEAGESTNLKEEKGHASQVNLVIQWILLSCQQFYEYGEFGKSCECVESVGANNNNQHIPHQV